MEFKSTVSQKSDRKFKNRNILLKSLNYLNVYFILFIIFIFLLFSQNPVTFEITLRVGDRMSEQKASLTMILFITGQWKGGGGDGSTKAAGS